MQGMASDSMNGLLNVENQPVPSDVDMRRLFHPTKMRVEKISLRRSMPRWLWRTYTSQKKTAHEYRDKV